MDNCNMRECERELEQARGYLDGALDRATKLFILGYIQDLEEKLAGSGKITDLMRD